MMRTKRNWIGIAMLGAPFLAMCVFVLVAIAQEPGDWKILIAMALLMAWFGVSLYLGSEAQR